LRSGSGEHLFIDVDMDGGMDVKMEHVTLPPIRNVVMVDTNEGVENICLPSSSFKSHLQCMGIDGSTKCYKVKSHK
jgi:hypothetical protein